MTAREYDREGRLPRFSLDRRITVLVIFLTLVVVGTVATRRIPVELFPQGYDDPFLLVHVPWENAPPREALEKIGLPLEEELSTVRGVNNMYITASTRRSRAYLFFKHGTDMDVAYREVRDRLERARNRFPDDVDHVYIFKDDASGIPVYLIGVAVDEAVVDSYNLIQNEIVLPLTRVDGVASVTTDGLVEKEILIELDRDRTAAAGLNIYDLAQELGADNFTMASGNVRDGSRKLLLRSVARYDDVDQLRNRLINPSVRLGDVATISYEQPDANFRVRAMGKPAVAVVVMKEGEANVREVSDRVAAVVQGFQANPRLRDVETLEILSQGKAIDEALATLFNSGMVGGLIAAMVLFLFMRRIRLMLILALAIPLSLLIGLTVMYFAGESLNLLTLLGLMLCVGLLVDNSVVVAENIHRLHRQGVARRQACIKGAGEVALAITMSTATTMVVFLPVALVAGPGQFFLLRLAIPVCVSVAASLIVALVFIPLCVYLTLDTNGKNGTHGKLTLRARAHALMTAALRWIYEQSFGRINRIYDRLLAFFLRRRVELVLVVFFVFLISGAGEWAPFQAVKFVAVQEEERNGFFIGVDMPDNTTLEETEAWFLESEKIVESKLEELDLGGWFHVHRKTHGRIEAWFNQPRTKKITAKEATKTIVDALPEKPGMEIHVAEDRNQNNEQDQSVWSLTLHGDDIDLLNEVADELQDTLVRVDGVLGMKGSDEEAANELALVIDRDRAQRYGVNPRVVAGVVGYALRGTPLPKYYKDGKEIPVRVRFREEDRESLTELAAFPIPTESGGVLPLSAVTEARVLPAPPAIIRFNKRVSSTLSLELEEGREEETRERLALLQSSIDLPEGISFGANRAEEDFDEDMGAMRFALFLSIIFIYLLMGFLFESFVLPLSIVLTIPLSAIGVYWSHFIVGYDIDMLGVVAMVLLVGVVVNNGIVLIDYVNRLRNQGMARNEAVLAATSRRFRPIMMTAITTIGGMVPLALSGANSIGLSYSSFAMTLIGGLTTATLLTLLVVPVFYTFFDDAREVVARRLRAILGSGAPPVPTERAA